MPTKTDYLRDPTLLFASGPFKGRPINLVGMRYRIVTEDDGSEHILFGNGSIAKFVRQDVCQTCGSNPHKPTCSSGVNLGPAPEVQTPLVCDECRPKQTNWYGPCEHAAEMIPKVAAKTPQRNMEMPCGTGYQWAAKADSRFLSEAALPTASENYEQWRAALEAPRIVPLRLEDGRRPFDPDHETYSLCIQGKWQTVDRRTVGTGWHELRWLYRKLVEISRLPIPAFFEAVRLYVGGR